jgi:glycerophosphoryl diester phosphodiesterase
MLPIPTPAGFRIIAHRGASGYAPENTCAAFDLARRMGVTEIELDLRLSKDRQLVLCHDESLDRYGHRGLRVADLTYDDLLRLDMGSWFSPFLYRGERILKLEQLFSEFGSLFMYHLEIKGGGEETLRRLLDTLDAFRFRHKIIITCFDENILDRSGEIAPGIPRGWLLRKDCFSKESINRAAEAVYAQICPRAADIDRAQVQLAKSHQLEVRAHSVNTREDIEHVINCGADGLTINWPDWLGPSDGR